MIRILAILALTALAACGAADAPSVEGGAYVGGFWRG